MGVLIEPHRYSTRYDDSSTSAMKRAAIAPAPWLHSFLCVPLAGEVVDGIPAVPLRFEQRSFHSCEEILCAYPVLWICRYTNAHAGLDPVLRVIAPGDVGQQTVGGGEGVLQRGVSGY